jgi:hypothetical protein
MTTPAPGLTTEIKTTETFVESYANHVGVKFTAFDFALDLGKFESPAPGKLVVTNFERVFLSPATAKALAEVLTNMVNVYQANHGPITKTEVGKVSFDAARHIPEGSRQ